MIWKTAEPQTTNTKRASIQGPTGYLSSEGFKVFGTIPRALTFFAILSLARRILCFEGILLVLFDEQNRCYKREIRPVM